MQPNSDPPPSFTAARNRRQKVRAAGLNPNHWYAVEYDSALKPGQVLPVKFWGRSIALYRDDQGQLHAIEDRCAHRQIKLSYGHVEGCHLVCPYHGWKYDGGGRVVSIPHTLFGRAMPRFRVPSYPVQERYGLIWIFPGDAELAVQSSIPRIPELEGPGRWASVSLDFTWKAHHSIILDNVIDLTHGYLHRRYRPFEDAELIRCDGVGDRVHLAYSVKLAQGRFADLFIDREEIDTNRIELCFEYPYQWSNTGNRIKHWCFLLPMDAQTTRVFFLMYFQALKMPLLPVRIPRALMTASLRLAKTMMLHPLLSEDGFAVEAEQEAHERNWNAPLAELNPAVGLCQDLIIRRWQEYLALESRVQVALAK